MNRGLRRALVLAPLVLLAGCATSTQIVGPDGRTAYSIRCGPAMPDSCFQKAGEVCPTGYRMLDRTGAHYLGQFSSGSVYGGWSPVGGTVSGSAFSTPMITPNTMIIECRPPIATGAASSATPSPQQ